MLIPPPAPDFSDPLALLHACHGRIEQQCATLLRLPGHLAAHGADAQAQQAAGAILRYFCTAGRHHHADEEADLFPLLRAAAGDDGGQLARLLEDLASQHRVMEARWQALQPWLDAVSGGAPAPAPAGMVEDFAAAYRQHIAQEERDLLPRAAVLLGAAQLQSLGARMAARRGLGYTGHP